MDIVGSRARRLNPALEPLAFLVGEWRTTGTHPALPDKELAGHTSFSWHEGGAFMIMRAQVDEPDFPDGVAVIGSDGNGRFNILYFDERGISRILELTPGDRMVSWTHEDPKFAQKLTIIAEGEDRLVSEGQMSCEGGPWSADLSQRFDRIIRGRT